jgi:SAM-dependent methyltransferase
MAPGSPEFDRHARNYSAGFDDPLKQAIGADARAFLRPKLALLRRAAARAQLEPDSPLRYLDYGCGAGDFLALVREAGLPWLAEGCEISPGMLEEAGRRWPGLAATAPLWTIEAGSFPEGRYDLITAICVFHHIPPPEWPDTFARLRRALRPGGLLCLFEHNPWNPVTRWMVSRTRIDSDAILLSPRTSRRLLQAAGFSPVHISHFLFVPPRWSLLARVEPVVGWLPLGGQYLATAAAPREFQVAQPPGHL